ncbi:MAG TPA: VCBS repeat-containing protein [Planctomycetota bacterium]|nr:VCBS repeat-containing protein [Planctomycetota bacterium]
MKNPTLPLSGLAGLALSTILPAQYLYTQQVGLVTGPVVMTEGVILVDVDGDTDLDVVFANGLVLSSSGSAIQPTLLINKIDLGLGLVDETAARLPALAIRGTLAIAFDIDGDGDKDLVFSCNGPSQQRVYVNNGSGVFTDESTTRLPGLVIAAAGCAYGDVDQDGDLDLFFNDELSNGQLKLLLNDGTGVFTNVTATHVAVAPKTNQQDIVVCDIDNDGDLDVINIGKSSGQQIFFNDGTGHFLTMTTALLPAGTTLTYEAEAADLDNDGDLDLTMLSVSGLSDTVLRNNLIPSGTLSFTSMTTALTGGNGDDDNEWLFVDANNDGLLDIVNGSLQSNGEKLYINNGAFSFARATGTNGFSPLVDSTLDVAVGDLNGDGVFDIVTAQGESGAFLNRAYYGTGPADTQPPRFVHIEAPPAVATNPDGPWIVRATIQDSAIDDGETSIASATMDWSISHLGGVTTGSSPMKFLGGLFYRADLTPPPGVIMNGATVHYTLTATDLRGNSTTTPQQSFGICGLQRYGLGLGGTNTSLLDASGSTSPGGVATFSWGAAGPSTTGLLVLALARDVEVYPQGTVLVDTGSLIALVPIGTNATGTGALPIPIPPIPLTGLRVAFQTLFDVPFSLSNGVDLVICP